MTLKKLFVVVVPYDKNWGVDNARSEGDNVNGDSAQGYLPPDPYRSSTSGENQGTMELGGPAPNLHIKSIFSL